MNNQFWQKQDAVMINCGHTDQTCVDMMRLVYQRHANYCNAHKIDYWAFIGHPCPEKRWGAWDKVFWFKQALSMGYEYIIWLDVDAAIVSNTDLREAFEGGVQIGACLHDWSRIKPEGKMKSHLNVGVMYLRNTPKVIEFVNDWWDRHDSVVEPEGGDKCWGEQGLFNQMQHEPKYEGVITQLDDKWNSTINVNQSPNPVVQAWHGVYPYLNRLNAIRAALKDDWFVYRV